jgi:hypothetical protein
MAASVSTLVVSWKEAAESQESVAYLIRQAIDAYLAGAEADKKKAPRQ